jgi:hypothetical protein
MSIRGNRRRGASRSEIEDMALYLFQTEGGELEDCRERAARMLAADGTPWDDERLTKRGFQRVATYDYTAPNGVVVYQVLRYHHRLIPGAKTFVLRRPDGASWHSDSSQITKWVYGQGQLKIIYRWKEIADQPDEIVFVCEGEKDADRLASLGLLATTVAGQNWSETAAEALRGRDVFVLEDNDETGRENSEAAVEALADMVKSIRIVRLPDLPHKGDVSDWLDAGHTGEELIDVCAAAPVTGLSDVDVVGMKGKEVPVQRWAVKDRIPVGYVTLLSGHGAAGKSLLALQLCAAHVTSKPWIGHAVRPGPVMFVDAEDGVGVVHKRLADILRHYGSDFDQLVDLHLISLLGQDAVLAEANRSGKIEPTPLYRELLTRAGDIKPVLIVLASSADMFAGNEIDRTQVRQFISLLGRVAIVADGSVMLISHPSVAGMQNDSGFSGCTAWHNSVRSRLYLKGVDRKRDEEPTSDRRVLEFRKNQYGPVADEIVLQFQDGLFVPIKGATADAANWQTSSIWRYCLS